MKLCVKCGKRRTDKSYCKQCRREYGRNNYKENKGRYYAQAKKRDVELRKLVSQAKSKPCVDCGKSYPHYVMDLDHLVPSQKIANIADMLRHRWAVRKIKEEIAKCEPVCANCHRERTYGRQKKGKVSRWNA